MAEEKISGIHSNPFAVDEEPKPANEAPEVATVANPEPVYSVEKWNKDIEDSMKAIVGAETFAHMLVRPIIVDTHEVRTLHFRRPVARDRYNAIKLCGPDASSEEILMESMMACASYQHPTLDRKPPVPRDAFLSMQWVDSISLERKFSVFINSLAFGV
ncbi:MAG: hypothetical protein ABW007_19370 [Chitinophagaceae bacterium]